MMGLEIYTMQGDCLEMMKELPDASVDSVVTDPPYGLTFMGKAWDKGVPGVEVWREALRVLKPGGHLLAFAGTRTQHRMATAIEDAGFEIRDMIAWVYGSGFPKSLNVSKAIDKVAGAERTEVIGSKLGRPGMAKDGRNQRNGFDSAFGGEASGPMPTDITAPATPEAQQWDGWGTALKPALEPITVARKPLAKGNTVAANVLEYGTGALNVDGCRVGAETRSYSGGMGRFNAKAQEHGYRPFVGGVPSNSTETFTATGRWPANLIHDGSDEVLALFPDSKGQQGDVRGTEPSAPTQDIYGQFSGRVASAKRGDTGSAARYFYCAKASKKDRGEGNKHPTVKPTDLMRYLCRLVTPPGGTVLDPFMGSGSTGKACGLEGFGFIGIEKDPESFEIAERRIDAAYGIKS